MSIHPFEVDLSPDVLVVSDLAPYNRLAIGSFRGRDTRKGGQPDPAHRQPDRRRHRILRLDGDHNR